MFGNFQEQGKRNITNSRAPKIAKQEECWSYQMLRKKGLKLREKRQTAFKGASIRLLVGFASVIMEARQWKIFTLERKKTTLIPGYYSKVTFLNRGNIKTLQKIKSFKLSTNKLSLKEIMNLFQTYKCDLKTGLNFKNEQEK